ncbi:serine/threonine-protein kinase [Microtetraspora glauca]|uniref:non-specific serine/threonine protein kinase n=1 Tax=Microtetraspora glauca TaxID=1996 RepID=A0ABV3GSZ9_MICGL
MATGGSDASLGSRYVLLDEIGAGAMGTVWRARHRETGETVAVKMLRDSLTGDQDLVLRFVQERNVMRTLRHPNIVTVRDFVIEGERLALVMDLVEGGDLRTLLRQYGTLPPAEASRLMAQVADALAAAHAEGVVHRDIKPGNILLDGTTGQVRLTDFGVARIVHGPGLTQTTSIIGTPAYLPPEVADGSAPTPAVDVYAVGLILYELLAGRPPFVGDHPMALLRQHATAMPRRLPGMPDALWSVIWACAAKDPAERPAIGDVATMLHRATPSLAGLPALPPVARGEAPSVTSESLPSAGFPVQASRTDPAAVDTSHPAARTADAPRADGISPAGPDSRTGEGSRPGEETMSSALRGRSRRRLIVTAATATALGLSAAVVTVIAPWRAPDAGATGSAGESTESGDRALGAAGTPTPTPSDSTEDSPTPTPKSRPARSRTPEPAVTEPPTQPSPTKPATRRIRTPQPQRSATVAADPEADEKTTVDATGQDTKPDWRCRSWISTGTGTGTEMSPCMAMVGDVFYLLGRIRGASSVQSDIHIQLYDTDADVNVSQPFICSGASPSSDGAIVTCGPFTTRAPRTGAKHDVRQRWRKTGTAAFGGGAESPWIAW